MTHYQRHSLNMLIGWNAANLPPADGQRDNENEGKGEMGGLITQPLVGASWVMTVSKNALHFEGVSNVRLGWSLRLERWPWLHSQHCVCSMEFDGDSVHLVKYLLHTYEVLSSMPKTHVQKLGVLACICYTRVGEAGISESLSHTPSTASLI